MKSSLFLLRRTLRLTALSLAVALQTGRAAAGDGLRGIRDMTDRAVQVPVAPSNVLSLCTSATDAMVALKASARLAAIEEFGRVVPGTEKLAVIGKGSAISCEEVIKRQIDLAFVWWYQDDADRLLRQLGVPVVRLRSGKASDVPAMLRLVGDCLNSRDEADRLAASVEVFLKAPPPGPAVRPSVYLELYGPFKTSGEGTYVNDLITLAGGTNVASGTSGSVVLSQERLIQSNPDVVLYIRDVTTASDLGHRGGLGGLDAVKGGRVYPVDRYWLVAGPHLPQSVAKLRGLLRASEKKGQAENGVP